MRMDSEHLEIFWDIIDGKYRHLGIEVNFTNCSLNDIFEGSDKYTPLIEKDIKINIDINYIKAVHIEYIQF